MPLFNPIFAPDRLDLIIPNNSSIGTLLIMRLNQKWARKCDDIIANMNQKKFPGGIFIIKSVKP